MKMTRQAILGAICGVVLLCGGLLAGAQSQAGSIHGTVTDPTGAVIPATSVTLSNTEGFSRSTTSNGNGAYLLDQVAPGRYTISVTAEGFAPLGGQEVVVIPGKGTLQNLALQLPVETQQVTVNDQALLPWP